jgi:hypothetical protein
VALVPPELNAEEGIYDVLFQILRDYQDDKYEYVRQYALRGLSDQSYTNAGSQAIANHGGPNKGIEYLVELALTNKPYSGMCANDHLDIQYEVLADLQGLLLFDNNNTWGPAAVRAGLITAIVKSFQTEPDYRPTLNFACKVISHLLMRNPSYTALLQDAGVTELVIRSIALLKTRDDTPFMFGETVSDYFSPSACDHPLMMLTNAPTRQTDLWVRQYIDGIHGYKPWARITV